MKYKKEYENQSYYSHVKRRLVKEEENKKECKVKKSIKKAAKKVIRSKKVTKKPISDVDNFIEISQKLNNELLESYKASTTINKLIRLKKKELKLKDEKVKIKNSSYDFSNFVGHAERIKRNDLLSAIKLLNNKEEFIETVRSNKIKEKCKRSIVELRKENCRTLLTLNPLAPYKILEKMRECYISNNWSSLCKLLPIFADVKRNEYECFKWKYAFLYFLNDCNAAEDLLDFLKMCVSCQTDEEATKFIIEMKTLNMEKDNTDDFQKLESEEKEDM